MFSSSSPSLPFFARRLRRPALAILLGWAGLLSLPAQTSYRGFYGGSLSSGANVYFYAVTNNDVTVIVVDSSTHNFGANNTIKITNTGRLSGNYSITTITGQIAADGTVTGNVAPFSYALNAQRAPASGPTQALAGFYQGWIFDPNNRLLSATVMASADGQFALFVQDGATVTDAGYGTIDARGIFSFTDPNGAVISGSIITTAAGNGWNGRYTKPGVGGYTFVVTRRDAGNRLINISTRGRVDLGDNALIAGFYVDGGAKTVLVRAIGPALADYGVTGFLADPQLKLFAGSVATAENDNWSTNANAAEIATVADRIKAFPLKSGSADAVLLVRLEPGAYSAVVTGANSGTGVALIEVYEVE